MLSLDYHNNLVVLFVAGLVNQAVRLHKMAAIGCVKSLSVGRTHIE